MSARRRGRPNIDLAVRCQNWVWYWMVKQTLALSDDKLDAAYAYRGAQRQVRRRVFHRIKAVGSTPAGTQGGPARDSIYARVHAAEPIRLAMAKQVFESEIWSLLQRPDRSATEYSAIIEALVECKGWYRAPIEDWQLGRAFLGHDEPGFELGLSQSYRAMLQHLAEVQPDIDALTLLVALFREAYAAFELDHAMAVRTALRTATALFRQGLDLPESVGQLVERLVWDRVLHNRIVNGDDGELRLGNAPPATRVKQFVQAYNSGQLSARQIFRGSVPIVRRTARIDWLAHNREDLKSRMNEDVELAQAHSDLDQASTSVSLVGVGQAKGLIGLANPPSLSSQARLPNADPQTLVMASLEEHFLSLE